jgi:hypothetical protein
VPHRRDDRWSTGVGLLLLLALYIAGVLWLCKIGAEFEKQLNNKIRSAASQSLR